MPSPDQVGPGIGATSAAASAPSVRSDPPPVPGRGLGANLLAVGAAAARPITDWWPTQGQYARDGFDMMMQGWRDMTSMPVDAPTPDTVIGVGAVPTTPEAIRGLGEIAWGAAGYFGAPINAAIHTLIGQPVENITGIPSKYTDFDVGLVLPFLEELARSGRSEL